MNVRIPFTRDNLHPPSTVNVPERWKVSQITRDGFESGFRAALEGKSVDIQNLLTYRGIVYTQSFTAGEREGVRWLQRQHRRKIH